MYIIKRKHVLECNYYKKGKEEFDWVVWQCKNCNFMISFSTESPEYAALTTMYRKYQLEQGTCANNFCF